MSEQVMEALLGGVAAFVAFLVLFAVFRRKKVAAMQEVMQAEASAEKPADKPVKESARTRREKELKELRTQRTCRYHPGEPATMPVPEYEEVRPWYDWFLNRLNAEAKNVWRLSVWPVNKVPEICDRCQVRARILMAEELLTTQQNKVGLADRICVRLQTYERYGLDEQMAADMDAIRSDKPQKTRRDHTTETSNSNLLHLADKKGKAAAGGSGE
jgi:hypothetical protein